MPNLTIAIIGSGASGSLTLIQLLRKLQQSAHIRIYEKRPAAKFRGTAYSSALVYEPLNVPASKMSLYPERPDDFYNWLQAHKANTDQLIGPDSFVSRRWFGEYVQATLDKAITEKAAAVTVECIEEAVVEMAPGADGLYLLQTEFAVVPLPADIVIFSTGNEPPADVIPDAAQIALDERYVSNPWQGNPFALIEPEDTIMCIGTGLTMVDHVISLKRQGHAGKIYALSRHGLIPEVHEPTVPYTLTQNLLTDDIEQLIGQLKTELKIAEQQGVGWRSVLDALRPQTKQLWQNLSSASKKIFLKYWRVQWDSYRHLMPVESANELAAMQSAGQLEIIAGKIIKVTRLFDDSGCIVTYELPNEVGTTVLTVQRVINCTGPSGHYDRTNSVYAQLAAEGKVALDQFGLGILTGPAGEIIQSNGQPLPHCFAVGPVRKASDWETTAIREIREQAVALADLIVQTYQA